MSMLGLNETIGQMAMKKHFHLYDNVLRREDDHVLRMKLLSLIKHWPLKKKNNCSKIPRYNIMK